MELTTTKKSTKKKPVKLMWRISGVLERVNEPRRRCSKNKKTKTSQGVGVEDLQPCPVLQT